MHDLTLVGVHDDGEHLVLISTDGQKFRVRVDEPLRAAVRRDRPRLGQLQLEMGAALRPREIQARIRAGETAEHLAEISGLAVEHIRRYEGPVLAEREFVARQARNVRMRGFSRHDGTVPYLGELVADRLAAREVDAAHAEWDSYRGEDGIWLISLTFEAGGRQRRALWSYDTSLKHVSALDDESRWLSEPQREGTSPGAAVNRRLLTVHGAREGHTEHVFDVEADGNLRTVQPEPVESESAATIDLLDSLRERRGRRQPPITDFDVEDEDLFDRSPAPSRSTTRTRAYHSADASAQIPAAHPTRSRADLADDAEILDLIGLEALEQADATAAPARGNRLRITGSERKPVPSGSAAPTATAHDTGVGVAVSVEKPPAGEHGAAHQDTDSAQDTQPVPAVSRRGKRASVPSWDDIVFGGRRE